MQKLVIVSIILFIAVALFLYAQQSAIPKDFDSITAEEVKKKIENKEDLLLLDVRTPGEFNGPLGHLEGAILIPDFSLADSVGKLEKYKGKEVIVYCRSGNRSQNATRIMLANGYKAVNMLGGMKAWNKL
ncbi:MAG: rhodanese-like domain-containing protein [Calditrichaeota bacterium]|nr:MAG: rhodanese-like domain-containing protein [Calditrichota bacterium]MBL1205879.1 rhodanese-like domain-containing protein [Calditrichota bacterium]NOG45707.1 rhodanese-like domain-containing protein [Calditrichota bacterium]